jgi:hypothetical protein
MTRPSARNDFPDEPPNPRSERGDPAEIVAELPAPTPSERPTPYTFGT